MIPTAVATLAAVALLVPAILAGSTDGAATDQASAAALAADVQQDADLRALKARSASSARPIADPKVPAGLDLQSMGRDGLESAGYVLAAVEEITEAPEPEVTETSQPDPEPEPEPEPTQTSDPEPEPAQTSEAEADQAEQQDTSSSSGGAHTSPDGQYTYEHSIETWERLAQCESNGDWSINTGNGYYGGIQFSKSSWDAVGGSGYPHENSKWEQIHRGELLHDQQGWGAWPECSRKLGLR